MGNKSSSGKGSRGSAAPSSKKARPGDLCPAKGGPGEVGRQNREHQQMNARLPKDSPGWKYPENDIRHLYALNKQPLGRGSFGLVLKAKNRVTGELFAVKIVDKEKHKTLDVQALFQTEIGVMSKLRHPNILSFHATYEDPKFFYAVFDLCTGGELFEEINRLAYFTEYDAVRLVKQMLSAIKYVHESGFIHRDIKAENFMFQTEYEDSLLVMIDFGLATFYKKGQIITTLCGSPRYIAPEVLKRSYNEKCDMWSIGVIVYLMLFGTHPFGGWSGASFDEIAYEVMNAEVDFTPYEGVEPPSEKATAFLKGLLTRNPTQRLSAADALKHPWLKAHRDELSKSVVDASVRTMAQTVVNTEKKQPEAEDVERKINELKRLDTERQTAK